MAGLPTLLVELDNGSGTFPFNITAYVDIQQGDIRTERGRQDEFDDIEAGEISLRLNNNDGRFTLGSATYGIVKDQRLRFTETVGVTVSRRFTGYVTDWPVRWTDAVGKQSFVTVTAVDRMARLARRAAPDSLIVGEIRTDRPAAYYAFGEAAEATSAGDTSGNGGPVIPAVSAAVEFVLGAYMDTTTGDVTGAQFPGTGYVNSPLLGSGSLTVEALISVPAGTGLNTLIAGVGDGAAGLATYLGVITGTGRLYGVSTTSTVAVNDGLTHHVAVTWNAATLTETLYVDGVQVGTGAGAARSAWTVLSIAGTSVSTQFFPGTIAHLAVTPSALSGARIALHALAALRPEQDSSDVRIGRYASFAGIATSDQSLEAGATRAVVAPTTDTGNVLDAMQDTAKTEGGALFINGAGMLVFQSRYRRPLSIATAAVFTIGVGDPDPDSLVISSDDQYLFNDVTGTRPDGAIQRSKNDASLAKYEQYPDSLTLNVSSDAEVLDRITWRANIYAEPLPRLSSVTIDLLTQTTAQQAAALGIEIGSKITISGLPTQSPFTTSDLFVEGLTEAVGRDKWTLTLNTVSADLFRAWILEDATYGVLETTTRLYF